MQNSFKKWIQETKGLVRSEKYLENFSHTNDNWVTVYTLLLYFNVCRISSRHRLTADDLRNPGRNGYLHHPLHQCRSLRKWLLHNSKWDQKHTNSYSYSKPASRRNLNFAVTNCDIKMWIDLLLHIIIITLINHHKFSFQNSIWYELGFIFSIF